MEADLPSEAQVDHDLNTEPSDVKPRGSDLEIYRESNVNQIAQMFPATTARLIKRKYDHPGYVSSIHIISDSSTAVESDVHQEEIAAVEDNSKAADSTEKLADEPSTGLLEPIKEALASLLWEEAEVVSDDNCPLTDQAGSVDLRQES